jgi:hypothetical protein
MFYVKTHTDDPQWFCLRMGLTLKARILDTILHAVNNRDISR